MESHRPYIGGLDEIEFSKLMKDYFKWDGMFDYVRQRIDNNWDKSDYIDEEVLTEVSDNQIHRVLGSVEEG